MPGDPEGRATLGRGRPSRLVFSRHSGRNVLDVDRALLSRYVGEPNVTGRIQAPDDDIARRPEPADLNARFGETFWRFVLDRLCQLDRLVSRITLSDEAESTVFDGLPASASQTL